MKSAMFRVMFAATLLVLSILSYAGLNPPGQHPFLQLAQIFATFFAGFAALGILQGR